MYYVYILKLNNGKLYSGYTANLRRRIAEHKRGASTYTKKYLPVRLIFYEAYSNQEDALRREKYFKTDMGKTTLRLMLAKTLGTY